MKPAGLDRTVVLYILPLAFFARLSAALFHYYIAPLPDGTKDAVTFERVAWELSTSGIGGIFSSFDYNASYIYSLLMAFPYALLGRNPLMLQTLSVLVGTFCVYLTWKLAVEIWDRKSARAAAWIVALFPTLIMYSALTMREVYFVAFVLMATIYLARWAQRRRWRHAGGAALLFVVGAAFHPASIAGLAALAAMMVVSAFRRLLASLLRSRLHLSGFALLSAAALAVPILIWLDPSIPKIGPFTNIFDAEFYLRRFDISSRGSAAYPQWLSPQTPVELLWIVPLRAVYLLFSPFVWDVQSAAHLIGHFDALLYLSLVLAVIVNCRYLSANPAALAILLVFIAGAVMLGAGTGNFGTGLRHRAKLLPLLVVLAAPFFARIVLWPASGARSFPPQPSPVTPG